MTDAEVRAAIEGDPDARPTDATFWKGARLVMPEPRTSVTIRLDADVVRFSKREPCYQTKIKAVLRSYMRAKGGDLSMFRSPTRTHRRGAPPQPRR